MTNKRFIVAVLVVTIAMTGLSVGAASADEEGWSGPHVSVAARVAEILGLDHQAVDSAFQQALREQRDERQSQVQSMRDNRLQSLMDGGALTEQQLEEWLASHPDNRKDMQPWLESRPGSVGPLCMGPGARTGFRDRSDECAHMRQGLTQRACQEQQRGNRLQTWRAEHQPVAAVE